MTDCSNVEIRELLPDYLLDSVGAVGRQRVEAHLAACATCRDELATLRLARSVMSAVRTPAIDTGAIVRSLPRPSRVPSRPLAVVRPSVRRSPAMLRVAAAITFIALGGISVAMTRAYFGGLSAPAEGTTAAVSPDTPTVAVVVPSEVTPSGVGTAAGVTLHASWHELDDAALESLMGALDELEAAPLAEPETIPGGRAVDGSLSGT